MLKIFKEGLELSELFILCKKELKKYILSFFAAIIAIFTLVSCSNNKVADSDGTIKVELVDLEEAKEEKQIEFKSGDTILDLLEANFSNVKVEGTILKSIENLYTASNWDPYISIIVDGEYSNYGITELPIYDGMVLTLKMVRF